MSLPSPVPDSEPSEPTVDPPTFSCWYRFGNGIANDFFQPRRWYGDIHLFWLLQCYWKFHVCLLLANAVPKHDNQESIENFPGSVYLNIQLPGDHQLSTKKISKDGLTSSENKLTGSAVALGVELLARGLNFAVKLLISRFEEVLIEIAVLLTYIVQCSILILFRVTVGNEVSSRSGFIFINSALVAIEVFCRGFFSWLESG